MSSDHIDGAQMEDWPECAWVMPDDHEPVAVRRKPAKRGPVDWLTVALFIGFTIGAIIFASVGAWLMIWLEAL